MRTMIRMVVMSCVCPARDLIKHPPHLHASFVS